MRGGLGSEMTQYTPRFNRRSITVCRLTARTAGLFTAVTGGATLVGWWLDVAVLRSGRSDWASMKPDTALALVAAGLALASLSRPTEHDERSPRWWGGAAASLVLLLGTLALARALFNVPVSVGAWLAGSRSTAGVRPVGDMSVLAAVDLALLGAALLLIALPARPALIRLSQAFAVLASFGALIAVAGYFYGPTNLGRAAFFTSTAVHTAWALLVLSVGTACARPEQGFMALLNADSAGGMQMRRLLLPIAVIPIVLNWAELEGERRGAFPPAFGWMLDSAVTVLSLAMLLWLVARVLHKKDVVQQRTRQELQFSEERYRQLVETSPLAVTVKDEQGIVFANPAAAALVGVADATDLMDKSPFSFVHPDFRPAYQSGICRVLRDGKALLHMDQRLLRLDGAEVDIEYSATPVEYNGRRLAQVVARDTTDRRRIEEHLRASVERMQLVARATGDAIWDWDVVNDSTWWSDTFYEKFGYSTGTIPTFEAWLDHVHPDDRTRATAEFQKAVEEKVRSWTSEYRFRRADGSYGVIFDRAYGILDASGVLIRMVGSMVDITDLRQAEEQARLLAHAVESSNDLISITDLDGRFIFVNRSFLDAYGYARHEVIGQTPALLALDPHREPQTHELIRESVLDGRWSGDLLNRRKDGSVFPLQLNASSVRDPSGRVVALMGVAQDVTKRKQAEDALRESEAKFRATFEQAALGICVTGLDGRFLRVNERLCKITGYSASELLARSFRQITHPDDLALDLENERRVIAGEIDSYTMEKRYVREAGDSVWVRLTSSLVRRGDGAPDYFISVIEDISPQRLLEAQLLQAQKMEAVGRLAGGIAHDFNNILTVIQGHLGLLELEPALDPAVSESCDEIGKAVHRATDLTRQLLRFSRREIMQPRLMDLNEVVTRLARMLHRLIGEDVILSLQLSEEALAVRADTGMIEQVLMNLAVNARDAMPRGGALTIETSERTLGESEAERERLPAGRYARLHVSDTGSGIPAEILPHVFEPFFTTKEAGRGTGLGLATVFGIIQQHGGLVRVESHPGKGAAFEVFLPLAPAHEASELTMEQTETVPAEGTRGRGETVLLAEDDPGVRHVAQAALERHGYRVVAAIHGDDAWHRSTLEEQPVNLLITDLVMPGTLSGTALAAKLRQVQPTLKVIFTSGYSAEFAGQPISLAEGQAFLPKPFDISRLLDMTADLLHTS